MLTRAKDGIVQTSLQPTPLLIKLGPTSYKLAFKHPKWLEAMQVEYTILLHNNT